jgi:hypothetical protein
MSELREGFEAWARSKSWDFEHTGPFRSPESNIAWHTWQAAIAYIRHHDGRAEFVQVVKAFCVDKFLHRHEKLEEIESLCDRSLCAAEIAKEQSK